jgi:hypothetical protein
VASCRRHRQSASSSRSSRRALPFVRFPRERARAALGVTGSPVILWVGRLTHEQRPVSRPRGPRRRIATDTGRARL